MPSSPSADYEAVSSTYHTGDDHIWDVWHGRVPFSTYETHRSRFVTEYGFQSFPEMKTIEAFTPEFGEERAKTLAEGLIADTGCKQRDSGECLSLNFDPSKGLPPAGMTLYV